MISKRGFDRKMQLLRGLTDILREMHKDAASFIKGRIVNDILDGPEGHQYPKTGYPTGISEGASGFVGIISGNLKSSIQVENREFSSSIEPDETAAPIGVSSSGYTNYAQIIGRWSQEKYGANFMEIALRLYGPQVDQVIRDEIAAFIRDTNNRQQYRYTNPFPA